MMWQIDRTRAPVHETSARGRHASEHEPVLGDRAGSDAVERDRAWAAGGGVGDDRTGRTARDRQVGEAVHRRVHAEVDAVAVDVAEVGDPVLSEIAGGGPTGVEA